jgi:hypothetical protein
MFDFSYDMLTDYAICRMVSMDRAMLDVERPGQSIVYRPFRLSRASSSAARHMSSQADDIACCSRFGSRPSDL